MRIYIILDEHNNQILASRDIDRTLSECKFRLEDKCQNISIKVMSDDMYMDYVKEYSNDK